MIETGEVHALMGKMERVNQKPLLKILTGVYKRDGGTLRLMDKNELLKMRKK